MPLAFVSLASSYARSLGRRFRTLTSAHADAAAALSTTGRAVTPTPSLSPSHHRAARALLPFCRMRRER
ncbi:hypothetical protein BZM27_15815, partial [Paraburkholderia steynii]